MDFLLIFRFKMAVIQLTFYVYNLSNQSSVFILHGVLLKSVGSQNMILSHFLNRVRSFVDSKDRWVVFTKIDVENFIGDRFVFMIDSILLFGSFDLEIFFVKSFVFSDCVFNASISYTILSWRFHIVKIKFAIFFSDRTRCFSLVSSVFKSFAHFEHVFVVILEMLESLPLLIVSLALVCYHN